MKKIFSILLLTSVCFAFTIDVQKKVIRQKGFDIECFVALVQPVNFNDSKTYYWFKSGEIHESVASSGGFVLHKQYSKYYKSNQLIQQGEFNYGLKTGVWKTWYKNGNLKYKEHWKNGFKEGDFSTYDSLGQLMVQGAYKNNLKSGQWIDYIKKDTTYHAKSLVFDEKPKNLIQRTFRKKDSLEKVQLKLDRINKRKTDSINKQKIKRKRLIEKRNDSIKRANNKLKRLAKKQTDSIERATNKKQKKPKKGFLNTLFKKKKDNK